MHPKNEAYEDLKFTKTATFGAQYKQEKEELYR